MSAFTVCESLPDTLSVLLAAPVNSAVKASDEVLVSASNKMELKVITADPPGGKSTVVVRSLAGLLLASSQLPPAAPAQPQLKDETIAGVTTW